MSRLLINSEEYRKKMENRNIYTPNDEYDLNNSKMLNSISALTPYINVTAISKVLNPIEKIYDRIFNRTPIIEIGMKKLADQLLKTVLSNSSRQISEVVDLSSIIKNKNLKNVYTGLDYQITKIKGDKLTTKIGNLIEDLVGTSPINKLKLENRSVDTSRDAYLIENTGTGQLNELVSNISKNMYVSLDIKNNKFLNDNKYINNDENEKISKDYVNKLKLLDIDDDYFIKEDLITDLNDIHRLNLSVYKTFTEYYPTLRSGKADNKSARNKLIELLGYTGKGYNFENKIDSTDILYGHINNEDDIVWGFDNSRVNQPKIGLLYYTSKIIKASENRLIDITKKKIFDPKNNDKFIGYNGSGIYYVPEDSKQYNDELYDGIRQHVMYNIDDVNAIGTSKYDTYAKAIRFNGNEKYNGNKNSVIYKTVKPRITPKDNSSKNLMFSIENLAVNIKQKDFDNKICYLENNTVLPLSEAGPLGGRIMWFPPYDVKLTEDVSAKRTSTEFIGRGENVYTYDNTERNGNLSFKLLIDYPPQLRNISKDSNFHMKAAQFFAFGGFNESQKYDSPATIEEMIKNVDLEIEKLSTTVEVPPLSIAPVNIEFYFDNDRYDIEDTYEDGITDVGEVEDFGLNVNGKTGDDVTFEDSLEYRLTKIVETYLINENKKQLDIIFKGYSSKLYLISNIADQYNTELSTKRCESVKQYLNSIYRLSGLGDDIATDFNIEPYESVGSKLATQPNTVDVKDKFETKKERKVEVIIKPTKNIIRKERELSNEEKDKRRELLIKRDKLTNYLAQSKQYYSNVDYNSFNEITNKNTNFNRGFEGVENNIFQPCFYSQTPESFHRRLTFLQQCMRQGQNIDNETSKNSVFGRQPVAVLRYGDFIHSKIIIENISFSYDTDNVWDLNPEGMGVQPMIADISIKFKFIGGQSMEEPISELQNALSFNYYANSTFYDIKK